MRTFPRNAAVVAALATTVGAMSGGACAQTQTVTTTKTLSSCNPWTIIGGVFSCTETTTGGGGGTTPPSGCSVRVQPTQGPAGTPVNVDVVCSAGVPTQWSWVGGFMNGSTQPSGQAQLSASATFSATVGNAAGTTNAQSGSFTLTAGGGGGSIGGGISCAPYGTVVLPVATVPGQMSGRYTTLDYGGFGNGAVAVVPFKTSPATTGSGALIFAEFASGTLMRTASISTSACDFTPVSAGGTALAVQQVTGWTAYFTVGNPRLGYLKLNPNTQYFMNIKNQINGVDVCGLGTCDILAKVLVP